MATKIDQLKEEDQLLCAGAGNADASDGILYSIAQNNQADLNPEQRVLIIGLGGQGIKSVNRIKKDILSQYRNVSGKIAFAAIDTDATDMKNYTVLSLDDKFIIPSADGIEGRYNDKKAGRSPFTKTWINPDFFVQNLKTDGANQIRQAMRAKLFDASAVTYPTDEQLIDWLSRKADSVLGNYDSTTMKFRVHIITGVAGGTGSGGLVEIAHFVRRACANKPSAELYGYMYLPDVVEEFRQGDARMGMYSNGYAALKELDYYYSVTQRDDVDYLYVNGNKPPLAISKLHPLYDMVYLVSGTNGTGVTDKNKNAIDTVAQSIVDQLGDASQQNANQNTQNQFFADSFLANYKVTRGLKLGSIYDTDGKECDGECGDDSFNYNAIGVATAAIPSQTIKMYAISRLMRTISGRQDGFRPTADFKGFSQIPLTPAAAQSEINKIFGITPEKMEDKIRAVCQAAVEEPSDPGFDSISRNDIISGSQNESLRMGMDVTGAPGRAMTVIKEWLGKELDKSREAIRAFLKNEGPMSFAAMFRGTDPAGKHYENSFERILQDSRVVKLRKINVTRANARLDDARDVVARALVGMLPRHAAEWKDAFRANEIEKVADQVAGSVFGEGGLYYTEYIRKIEALAREILVFDYTLQKLYAAYDGMGTNFETHDDFIKAAKRESSTVVNLIEADTDYQWAKQIVDKHSANMAFSKVKDAIIDSFMEDPKRWTEYDVARPEISPRREMDRIVADQVRFDNELNVVSYIQHKLDDDGVSTEDVVKKIVDGLTVKAVPLYHVKEQYKGTATDASFGFTYLIIPKTLVINGVQGTQLMNSFTQFAAKKGVKPYFIPNADDIVCYSMYCALPSYALSDLPIWQAAYENPKYRMFVHSNESGKGLYDPETGLTWLDYPSLCLKQDPREPDEQGNVSREGKFFRNIIDDMFQKAMDKGIIVEDVTEDGSGKKYSYSCFLLNKAGWDYTVDFDEYAQDEDGLYPMDIRLFRYFMERNHGNETDVKRKIRLEDQGLFNEPYPVRRIAMERAKRALRRNVPLFLALKKTLAKYDEVTGEIQKANAVVLQKRVGTLVPYYIAAGLFCQPTKNRWFLMDYPEEGSKTEVCKTDPFFMTGNPLFSKGFKYLILWKAFMDKFSTDPRIQTMYQPAFSSMMDDPATYAAEFAERLRPFKEEAEGFVRKYSAEIPASTGARTALCKEMNLKPEGLDELVERYQQVLVAYEQIREYIE